MFRLVTSADSRRMRTSFFTFPVVSLKIGRLIPAALGLPDELVGEQLLELVALAPEPVERHPGLGLHPAGELDPVGDDPRVGRGPGPPRPTACRRPSRASATRAL
jgi:hypothetical protein